MATKKTRVSRKRKDAKIRDLKPKKDPKGGGAQFAMCDGSVRMIRGG